MSRPSPRARTGSRPAPVFAALGDETRLALVARLSSHGPLSITRLTTGSSVTRQAVTKHLNVLARAGLASDVRRGRERIWELDPQQMKAARLYLDQVSKRWDDALARLKTFVADEEESSGGGRRR
jgi:DNA-binding transcriptional ArsR family regulator